MAHGDTCRTRAVLYLAYHEQGQVKLSPLAEYQLPNSGYPESLGNQTVLYAAQPLSI